MGLSDTSNGDIGWKKWLIAGWAFMECVLFGGLMYGWASVSFVLKMEGIYGCDLVSINGTVAKDSLPTNVSDDMSVVSDFVCKQQDTNMALCYTIASSLAFVGCAVFGYVNYKFGTRVTRIISFMIFIIGSIMMAFISKDNPWLMYPGLTCLGIAGLPILVTNAQLAHQSGFSRQNMFIIITAFHVLVLVSTFLFLPKDYIVRPEARVDTQCEIHEEKVCRACVKDNKGVVSYFLDVCMYTMIGGLLTSLLSGSIYDWQKTKCKDAKTSAYREVMPAVLPLAITCTLSLSLSILVLIPVTELLYVSFIVMTVYRSFLYSIAAAFLNAL
ncbi:hypothetical protein ACF0H5_000381 [Mactra antiquata]